MARPATYHDRTGATKSTPEENEGIFLVGSPWRVTQTIPNLVVGLGGLVFSNGSTVMGGFSLTEDGHLLNVPLHGPRMSLTPFYLISKDLSLVLPKAYFKCKTDRLVLNYFLHGHATSQLSLLAYRCLEPIMGPASRRHIFLDLQLELFHNSHGYGGPRLSQP